VLVPLRGVLEAMGAYVEFVSATNTILANRGSTQIEMRLGQSVATVGGRPVTLEVPAMTMRGSTMVPLRFIGEALGADVKWVSATQTVEIMTANAGSGGATTPPPTGGTGTGTGPPLEVTSIDVRPSADWLKPGDTVQVELRGTPGAMA